MGDSLDTARTHFRKHVRSYQEDANSQEALDNWHRRDVEDLARELSPIKSKIIGAISGNHYWEFMDGTNSEQYLCQLLGIRYLGPMAAVRLEFVRRERRLHYLTMVAHHNGGSQGGRTTGGDVNALNRFESSFDADIYLLSHTHRRHGHKETGLMLSPSSDPPQVLERTKVFVRTGAFLKGFKPDNPTVNAPHFPGYAELRAYRPTDLGWVKIHINLTETNSSHGRGAKAALGVKQDITLEY
jgi:hypothetical protein